MPPETKTQPASSVLEQKLVGAVPLSLLRSLAKPLRDLELRHAGRTLLISLAVGIAVGGVACLFFIGLHAAELFFLEEVAGYAPMLAQGEQRLLTLEPRSLLPWMVVAVPALGGLLTGLLGHYLAPEILGGGGNSYVAAFHDGGFLRRRVLALKLVASISTLGSGGSGGREGPTMLIGAAVGNLIGRALKLSRRDRRLLLVAGTAGGLSAVFGTPLGAGLLATEILYRDDFESDALAPAIFSSVTAFSVFRLVFPQERHLFGVAERYAFEPRNLWLFIPLALAASLGGHLFLAQLHAMRRLFASSPIPRWLRPAIGGFLLGVLALVWISFVNPRLGLTNHGIGILGSGYGVAQAAILTPEWMPAGWAAVVLLGTLAVVKMLATALTLESGGSAGDFGPSVTIGALLGGAFGRAVALAVPGAPDPGAFALVGMAAFYGGLAHAPLAAVVMVCEMAGSYDLLVPLMLGVGLSYLALRRVYLYPAQLESRAAAASEALLLETMSVRAITTLLQPPPVVVADASPDEVRAAIESSDQGVVVVTNTAGRVTSVIERRNLSADVLDPALSLVIVAADLASPIRAATLDDKLAKVLSSMIESSAHAVPLVEADGRLVGVLTEHEITEAYYSVLASRRPPPLASEPA
jgi:CIC family chloride channel protein